MPSGVVVFVVGGLVGAGVVVGVVGSSVVSGVSCMNAVLMKYLIEARSKVAINGLGVRQ